MIYLVHRISKYTTLCYNFSIRGFPIGDDPRRQTVSNFWLLLLLFVGGSAIYNMHLALVFCGDSTKQVCFRKLRMHGNLSLLIQVLL